MSVHEKLLCSTVALFALAACGGSSGGNGGDVGDVDDVGSSDVGDVGFVISSEEQVLRVFAEGVGDVSDVLASDGSLSARSVSLATTLETYTGFDVGTNELVEGSLRFEGDGDDLLVTFSTTGDPTPTTVRIVGAASLDDDQVVIDNPDMYFDLFVGNGQTFADLFDSTTGSGYAVRVGLYFQDGDDNFGLSGRGVIGTETTDMIMEQLAIDGGSASYSGYGSVELRQTDATFNGFNGFVDGNVALVADFGAGEISGEMTNLFYQFRTGPVVDETGNPDGSILFNNASLGDVNGFQGTMSASPALRAANDQIADIADGLTYSGAFYGPAAEEVGGAIEGGPTTIGEDSFVSNGFFTAIDRD
ncbi:hypothetical protein DFP92_11297 [Yoonia sediminilitoris]|uniref:Transferrin-binding protein B C-lobe/N-lobe beta-barrel domain-containing protein n=2 Tax=Yoonia sediminilitoris TaxID=1286148 RepID=A0A2T6KAM7_9RHOB|nr:hypothetical protein C8N45_11297 [Yoonia sediminilitoris]RCW91931.1 hypothetical protein DFP92_11297 [Yoonia sediminilitoris]